MKSPIRIRPIDWMLMLSIAGYCGFKAMDRPPRQESGPSTFAREVDLSPLYHTAVHADGRLRSFDSHAKTYMAYISGPRSIHGQSNGFTYLDLIFRPERYVDADLIYVKNKLVRAGIVDALGDHPDVDAERAASILKRGTISRTLLSEPAVVRLLQKLGRDLIRTSKAVDAIGSALAVSDGAFLLDQLRLLAPPGGSEDQPWLSITRAARASTAPDDNVHAGMNPASPIPGLDPKIQDDIARAWSSIQTAWQGEDAAQVSAGAAELARLLPTISPRLYPTSARLEMESWYFRNKSMTWVWLLYLAAVIPLLICVVYKWSGARWLGLGLFCIAFAAHTASVAVRWYISGRWPNSNMFEALTTSVWFGGVLALILERVARRSVFRNLFALGSAVMSMAALMAAYFLPAQLDSAISNKMAALNDVWLYIHTNMIIWSYAVIGLACVPAMLQLRHRWCVQWDREGASRLRLLLLPVALVVLNYTSYLLLMHVIDNPARGLSRTGLGGVLGAFWGSMLIVALEWSSARARTRAGTSVQRSAGGGAAALMTGPSRQGSFLMPERASASQVYDGATMILVELSFIMLWTGVVMGAIWADHSWGRPWGWDPKEVFALNTFIIFLILIHVRLKVRDKAFWTAVLAVIGFEVMMFNWIVVNFIISGLHSYA